MGSLGGPLGSYGVGFGVPEGCGALGVGEGLKKGGNGVPKNVFGVS